MQKKIIALAVAGLMSGAAFAQSNVTVYGVVDLGQAWVKTDGAVGANKDQDSVGRLDNNSSHIGFKGTEDLGNGLKAMFQLETSVAPDNGDNATKWTDRDSYVGLAGNFGTVLAGTLTHPLRTMGIRVDILPGAAGFGTVSSITGKVAALNAKTGADDRAKNAIAYVSPNFNGFTVIGAYVNGEYEVDGAQADDGKSISQKAWQLAAQYENGPLWLAGAYHKTYDFGAGPTTTSTVNTTLPPGLIPVATATIHEGGGDDASVWRLAAQYKFAFGTTVSFLYDNTEVDNLGDRSAWSLGANHTIGAHTIGLQYAKNSEFDLDGGGDLNDAAHIWTLGYQYAMSKRTTIHARYSKLSNDDGGKASFYNNEVKNPFSATAGSDSTGFMVGLRHSF